MNIVVAEPLGVDRKKLDEMSAVLREHGHYLYFYETRPNHQDELLERCKNANVVIIANYPITDGVIQGCAKLKLISVAFTGIDHIGLDSCRERGIMVCNAAGYSTFSVAELVFGLVIGVYRKLTECDTAVRTGLGSAGRTGHDLFGKTIGIVGTGAIGAHVAKIASAFGCRVLAYSRTKRTEVEDLGAIYTSLEMLLAESDIVTLHVPLNDQTRLLLNDEKIAMMKRGAILINTSRGPVVDSDALAEALRSGRIAGAGIDVFESEPPVPGDHPLLNVSNVLLTPHIAYLTHEALSRRAGIAFDNVVMWSKGTPQNVKMPG